MKLRLFGYARWRRTFFDKFNSESTQKCNVIISDDSKCIDVDPVYKTGLHELEVCLVYPNFSGKFAPGDLFFKEIGNSWCDKALNPIAHMWLRLADTSVMYNSGKQTHADVDVKEIAFGTFPTMSHFMQHYHYQIKSRDKEILSTFVHSQRMINIYMALSHAKGCKYVGDCYKFVVNYKSISRVIICSTKDDESMIMYLVLKHIPLLYRVRENRNNRQQRRNDIQDEMRDAGVAQMVACDRDYEAKRWERSLTFGCSCNSSLCPTTRIGTSPVFKIVFKKKIRTSDIMKRLIQRCATNTFFFFANTDTAFVSKRLLEQYKLLDFDIFPKNDLLLSTTFKDRVSENNKKFMSQYAWEVVNGRSLEVRDQLVLKYTLEKYSMVDHWKNLKSILSKSMENTEALCAALYHISEMIARNDIFIFNEAFTILYKHYKTHSTNIEVPKGMCLVRRLIITPSRFVPLPPSEHFDNRVIRQYGSEYLLRVSIQDDNFSKLTFAVQYHSKRVEFMTAVAGRILNSNIPIGPRTYEVLAASSSQLREHGLWMYAQDESGNTAREIRRWMGDFSKIRNVAKFMARMGQCFSSSEEAAQIQVDDEYMIKLNDIKTDNGAYTFSDGIGMISPKFTEEIRQALEDKVVLRINNSEPPYRPSAFQIRYKGCKGMVVTNPRFTDYKLGIRPSMEKFPCHQSSFLEIVKISAPRGLFLNRPLITILEQLGIMPNVFLSLQKSQILDMTDSLIYERKAWKMMSNLTTLDYPYRRLLKSGICLTQEPFFRTLLLSVYKVAIDMLRSKARIAIPPEYGRNMLGVLDETGTLRYGEVFVQYSEDLGNTESPTHVLKETVVVTKNPCMHPGDVRIFHAVDIEDLHHIKDCIVFPSRGPRPHPDEMAGSDLDGDEYVVIWQEELKFKKNEKPMEYPPNREKIHKGEITVTDMIDFLCEYVQNDNIGHMANAHLAWADCHDQGIFSDTCMSIARKYPKVLDFAKSGETCLLSRNEKPQMYPDFMEKGTANNSYKSKKALGMLYRVTRNLDACVSKIEIRTDSLELDPLLLYPGWERYEGSAEIQRKRYCRRVKNILKKYGMGHETEVLSGYVGKMNEYTENRYERDNALAIARTYLLETIKRFHGEFLREHANVSLNVPEEEIREVKFRRASAWYVVTYNNPDKSVLSFPWVVSDILCELREENLNLRNIEANYPKSSFIESSDEMLMKLYKKSKLTESGCHCSVLLLQVVQQWMTKSSINGDFTKETFCFDCFERIRDNFFSATKMKCCRSGEDKTCQCQLVCSPSKLILDFMKYFSTQVTPDLGQCLECIGFREFNLQSIALQTFASIAVTRDIQYLGFETGESKIAKSSEISDTLSNNEEGDPIRIPCNEDLQKVIHKGGLPLLTEELKEISGVKEVFINGQPGANGDWNIIVNSIGKQWQRWNLEEFMMDDNAVNIIKSRMDKKEGPSNL